MTESEKISDADMPGDTPQSENSQRSEAFQVVREKYWSGRFILTNLVIVLLAIMAGYLQYVAYPALMTGSSLSGAGFGETNVVLSLSFLTFQFSATDPNSNCASSGCVLKGVPAFDFCQALIYLLILVDLVRIVRLRSK